MDILFLSPDYPTDMPMFVAGLASVGARVIGVGDQHLDALTTQTRDSLWKYIQILGWADENAVVAQLHDELRGWNVDLVETLWEPTMLLAARLRQTLGVPGMTVDETVPFRDKGAMKRVVEAAGLRTPRSVVTTSKAGCREAAEQIGFPIIIKPISGAGSADTHRIETVGELEAALGVLDHIAEVSVEEFITGEEFTYDTVCAGGEILFENVCEYRPNPLIGKQVEWISPQVLVHRDLTTDKMSYGVELGRSVIAAMGFQAGFTHMEWYRKDDGEVVFGEIGARSAGGRLPDLMNFSCDTDVYVGWAEAVCHGTFSQPTERRYNVGQIIKRAQGSGIITRVEGVDRVLAQYGDHVVNVDLLPVGSPRRDWQATVLSDGVIVVRHVDLDAVIAMSDDIAANVHLYCD